MATSAEELNSGDFILHCPALPCPPFPSSAHPTPSSNTEIVNDSVERTHNYSARNCYNYYFNLRLMLKFGAKVQKSSKASYLGNIKIIMTLVGEWDFYHLFQRRLDNPGVSCVKPIVGRNLWCLAGCKESQFYSLPFRQAVVSVY